MDGGMKRERYKGKQKYGNFHIRPQIPYDSLLSAVSTFIELSTVHSRLPFYLLIYLLHGTESFLRS